MDLLARFNIRQLVWVAALLPLLVAMLLALLLLHQSYRQAQQGQLARFRFG